MAPAPKLDRVLMNYIQKVIPVASSRAKYVIEEILRNGFIDSETIRNAGYVHGARAIGDVRDQGIPLDMIRVKSSDGRSIARYVFGKSSEIRFHKFGGRINFPLSLKQKLINDAGPICAISKKEFPSELLQIDHRIPFYISGDTVARNPQNFMLLSASMQRSKSWACENCENIRVHFDLNICKKCYWAFPEDYEHIAMRNERRVDLIFTDTETSIYDAVKLRANEAKESLQDFIKSALKKLM